MHKTNFPDRAGRLNDILKDCRRTVALPLFHEAPIPNNLFTAIRDDCVEFLVASLRSAYRKTYHHSLDVLDAHRDDVLNLPNKTPNGLILPKKDNFLAYNQLQKTVCCVLRNFNLSQHVKKIHAPVNIRIIDGNWTENDRRPRASSKLHSDIWAGEFTDTVMVFLTALGDVENNGIEFFEPPQRFFTDFCKPLDDYLEGACLEAESERYDCGLRDGFAYFTDPFLLHRTVKKSNKLRLSIDFRFIPYAKCPTDIEVDTERHKNYIPLGDWCEIGSNSLLYTDVTVADSHAENIGPRNAYAAEYNILELKK